MEGGKIGDVKLTEDNLVAFFPHLGDDSLAGEDTASESRLDAVESAVLVIDSFAADAEKAQSMEDWLRVLFQTKARISEHVLPLGRPATTHLIESTNLGKVGINVKRVVVARQPVEGSLNRQRLVLGHVVGLARRRLVERGSSAAVLARLLSAESTRAANKDGALVLKDDFASLLVFGRRDGRDGCGFALVEDFGEASFRDESAAGRDWSLDREVLLAVKKHHRRKVGQPVDCVRARARANATAVSPVSSHLTAAARTYVKDRSRRRIEE